MTDRPVNVFFGAAPPELCSRVTAEMRRLWPDHDLILVSEFEEAGVEWVPYNYRRGPAENSALVKAKLAGRKVHISATVLAPDSPHHALRWMAFRLAPARFLAFNENLGHFMLRPRSLPTIVRHYLWRAKNLLVYHLFHGGFFYTWFWRLRNPALLRRPFYYRLALAAGRVASLIRAGSPKAAAPVLESNLPEGISVVIPSRNGRDLLAAMLPGVVAQLDPEHSEILVVDNGSSDGTREFLDAAFAQVRILTDSEPLSFAAAVNRGIFEARYSRVCLLNNDMFVEPGFFEALQLAFAKTPDLFAATAQIFMPEGTRREETGKASFSPNRDPFGFPVGCEDPLEGEDGTWVLYGSGGCSLYDTARLRALGGMGEVFAPAYVEDLDVGFRAWRLNWPTVYVAGARVVHRHRTTTSRYYSSSELTRVLERNYMRFLARSITDRRMLSRLWRESVQRLNARATEDENYVEILRSLAVAPGWIESQPQAALPDSAILAVGNGDTAVFPGRSVCGGPKVLIASPYAPYPLSHGGAVRMFNLMRRAAGTFDQILVCFADSLARVPSELLEICAEVIVVRRQTTHALPSSSRPDVVEEFDSPVFHAVLRQAIRKWKPEIAQLEFTQMALYAGSCAPAKTILVEHDITIDLYAQLLAQAEDWQTRQQYQKWVRFENQAWGRIDRIVTMSEKDRQSVGRAHAVVLANGVDLERFQPGESEPEPRRILFIGSFQHLPNLLALEFFLREVWPALTGSGAVLHVIAGSKPEFYLERYKEKVRIDLNVPGVELEGFVPDVRPAYRRAEVVVAPLLASAGTNIKIMEAMAMGKAIVSTPAGINGLHELQAGRDVVVVQTGSEMSRELLALFSNPQRRREIEAAARKTAEEKFDWDAIAARQADLYRSLIAKRTTERT